MKTKIVQVREGRALFRCPSCQGKRLIPVPLSVRRKTVHCAKCEETVNCLFNRRLTERNQQSGRVLLIANDTEAEVLLFDVSTDGVGFEMDIRNGLRISVGREVQFKCGWNSQLLSQGRYVVRSVSGLRVGAQRR
jgi:hypothetical protein